MYYIVMDMSPLASIVERVRRSAGLSQSELAARAGTSQPAIARLEQGRASPTLATLERLAQAAGFTLRVEVIPRPPLDPVIELYKRDVDRSLLRENLRKTVDERIRSLVELQKFDAEVRRAVRQGKRER